MVEPRALPIYSIIALCLVATGLLSASLGFTIDRSCWPIFWGFPLLVVGALLLRRIGHDRSATALEGVTLIYWQGAAFMLLLFPLAAISAPFADRWLDGLDKSLGFDWVIYVRFLKPAYPVLASSYDALNWQPLLLVVALCLAREERRMWQMIFAATIALAIAVVIFPFAPAIGAAKYHGFHLGNGRTEFGDTIAMLKAGHRLIAVRLFGGFISFPSYHAASAALFVWGAWPMKLLRWPLLVLNVIMCFAAIIFGGHYLVDIIGGLAVAAGSVAISDVSLIRSQV